MSFSKYFYYIRSIPTIVFRIRPTLRVLSVFLGQKVQTPFVITLDEGVKFFVRTAMDIWIVKETCLDRVYEVDGQPFKNRWTFIDIGAFLGDFAVSIAKRFPESTVIAVEPLPDGIAILKKNLKLNSVNNVHIYNVAIGAKNGPLKLTTATGLSGQHSTVREGEPVVEETITVKCITLDALFRDANIKVCDLLKIDCEGAEYDILMNASKQSLKKIRRITMEFHEGFTNYGREELKTFLQAHDFHVTIYQNPVHSHLGYLYAFR